VFDINFGGTDCSEAWIWLMLMEKKMDGGGRRDFYIFEEGVEELMINFDACPELDLEHR
jgi:hypothetical protein